LGKSVHLNRPGKKHNSGLGLPPASVAKIDKKRKKKRTYAGAGAGAMLSKREF